MTAAEKNTHYGTLNTRFGLREAELRVLGFKYEHIPALGVAVFIRNRLGKVKVVAAGVVMNADTVAWSDTFESCR